MGLAEKTFGLVFGASPRSTQQDDAVLLFSDRADTRSSFKENVGIQVLSENLISIGTTDSNRPEAALHEGLESAADGGRSRPSANVPGKWVATVAS